MVAGEPEKFPEFTGLVHISGVTDTKVAVRDMRDPHRVLVDPADRLDNIAQIRALARGGYTGPFSFEPFAAEIQALQSPREAIAASMDHIRAQFVRQAA